MLWDTFFEELIHRCNKQSWDPQIQFTLNRPRHWGLSPNCDANSPCDHKWFLILPGTGSSSVKPHRENTWAINYVLQLSPCFKEYVYISGLYIQLFFQLFTYWGIYLLFTLICTCFMLQVQPLRCPHTSCPNTWIYTACLTLHANSET